MVHGMVLKWGSVLELLSVEGWVLEWVVDWVVQ